MCYIIIRCTNYIFFLSQSIFFLKLDYSVLAKLYFENLLKYWWWVFLKCKETKVILSNGRYFSFHLISYHCKSFKFSPFDCSKFRFYLWFIYLIEFMLFMHVHLNNCLLNFARIGIQDRVWMHMIFHQSQNVTIFSQEKDIMSSCLLLIVTFHLLATNLYKWYYTTNWISFMTPQ